MKPEDAWHKVRGDVPMEYAATVTVNPLTALRMLHDFVELNPGDHVLLAIHLGTPLAVQVFAFMSSHAMVPIICYDR